MVESLTRTLAWNEGFSLSDPDVDSMLCCNSSKVEFLELIYAAKIRIKRRLFQVAKVVLGISLKTRKVARCHVQSINET